MAVNMGEMERVRLLVEAICRALSPANAIIGSGGLPGVGVAPVRLDMEVSLGEIVACVNLMVTAGDLEEEKIRIAACEYLNLIGIRNSEHQGKAIVDGALARLAVPA